MRGMKQACVHGLVMLRAQARRVVAAAACAGVAVAAVRCTSSRSAVVCDPDQDGIADMPANILLTVSDTGFAQGSPDSGVTDILFQNSSTITLTLTNVGTMPHDLVVGCVPTPNNDNCPTQACFPAEAGIPALQPGASATTVFMSPAHDGLSYPFYSDLPGDAVTGPDGGLTPGLTGTFDLQ